MNRFSDLLHTAVACVHLVCNKEDVLIDFVSCILPRFKLKGVDRDGILSCARIRGKDLYMYCITCSVVRDRMRL